METFSALFELASVSLACRDQDTLLKTFAARVGSTLGARAVFVWTNGASSKDAEGLVCRTRWNEAGERLAPLGESVSEGLLAEVYESAETRRVNSKEIAAEDFEHLDEPSRARVNPPSSSPSPAPNAPKASSKFSTNAPVNSPPKMPTFSKKPAASPVPRSPTSKPSKANGNLSFSLWSVSPLSTISAAPSLPLSNSASSCPSSPEKFATLWAPEPASSG